jgi:membrane-associated phospholipid phosphatase
MSEQMREQGVMSAFDWRRWTVLAVAGLVACLLLALLLDAPVTRALMQWPAEERAFFAALTRWGESDWILYPAFFIWLGALALAFFPMGWSARWAVRAIGAISGFLFVAVGAPGLVSALLKRLIGRARPEGLDTFGTLWFEPGAWAQYSLQGLPSGHATTSFALAFALVALFGRWWGVAFALAALIASWPARCSVHWAPCWCAPFSSGAAGFSMRTEKIACSRRSGSGGGGSAARGGAVALEPRVEVGFEIVQILEAGMQAEEIAFLVPGYRMA